MTCPSPVRRLLVVALAGWTILCCCERRALAELVLGSVVRQDDSAHAPGLEATDTCENGRGHFRIAPGCCAACESARPGGSAEAAAEDPADESARDSATAVVGTPTDASPGNPASDDGRGCDDAPTRGACCANGCCVKAATAPLEIELRIDLVGVEPPCAASLDRAFIARASVAATPDAGDPGSIRPPPWRLLIESARLRI